MIHFIGLLLIAGVFGWPAAIGFALLTSDSSHHHNCD